MISFKHNAIMIKNRQRQIIAELTYFRLPSKDWLLEQIFASSKGHLKRYRGPLIRHFFKRISCGSNCVRVLDPFAKAYLKQHQEYQKFLR